MGAADLIRNIQNGNQTQKTNTTTGGAAALIRQRQAQMQQAQKPNVQQAQPKTDVNQKRNGTELTSALVGAPMPSQQKRTQGIVQGSAAYKKMNPQAAYADAVEYQNDVEKRIADFTAITPREKDPQSYEASDALLKNETQKLEEMKSGGATKRDIAGQQARIDRLQGVTEWHRMHENGEENALYDERKTAQNKVDDAAYAIWRSAYDATQRPTAYSKENVTDYKDRIGYLAGMVGKWDEAQTAEAKEIMRLYGGGGLLGLPADNILAFEPFRNAKTKKERGFWEDVYRRLYLGLNPFAATGAGLGRGLGVESVAKAVGAALGADTSKTAQYYDIAQQAHPTAFNIGSIGGNIALLGITGAATGGLVEGAFPGASMGTIAAAKSAAAFAAADAIHNFGSVSNGEIDPGDYLKGVGISGAQGAAGNIAGQLVGGGIAKYLTTTQQQTAFNEFLRQTFAGTASASVNQATGYILRGQKPTSEELANGLITAFAFSCITSAANTLQTTNAHKAYLQSMEEQAMEKLTVLGNHQSQTAEGAIEVAYAGLDVVAEMEKALQENYFAGQQQYVDDAMHGCYIIRTMLDDYISAIENGTYGSVQGSASSSASGTGYYALPSAMDGTANADNFGIAPVSPQGTDGLQEGMAAAIQEGLASNPEALGGSAVDSGITAAAAASAVGTPENIDIAATDAETAPMEAAEAAPAEMVQSENNASTESKNRALVAEAAEIWRDVNGLERTINDMYNGMEDPFDYARQMVKAYDAGTKGDMMPTLGMMPALNRAQIEAAYTLGQTALDSGEVFVADAPKNSYTESIETEDAQNGREVYLREGGERNDGTDSAEQIRPVAEAARRVQSRNRQAGPKDSGATSLTLGKAVSSNDLGFDGTDEKTIRLVTGGETKYTKIAQQRASERGLKLVMFSNGDLSVKDIDATSGKPVLGFANGAYDPNTETVYVRVDDPDYTAEQIIEHEIGEQMEAHGEYDVSSVRKTVLEAAKKHFGITDEKKVIARVAEQYAMAYDGSDYVADKVFREFINDGRAGMNKFEGEEDAGMMTSLYGVAADEAERQAANAPRAPPRGGKGNTHFSMKRDVLALENVDWMDDNSSIKEQLKKHAQEINEMQPVAVVEYTHTDDKTLVSMIMEGVSKVGGSLFKRGSITFDFDEIGAKAIKGHARSIEERAAALASPYVAKKGKLISGHRNHEGKGTTTLTYAAPVVINGEIVNVGLVVQFKNDGRPHAVNVGLQDSGKFIIDIKKAPKGTNSRVYQYDKGTALSTMGASKYSIRTDIEKSQEKSFQEALASGDKETADKLYLEAVEANDEDALREMVDAAAKAAMPESRACALDGTLLVLYHQTDGEFTVFDTRHEGAGSRDNETPFGIFMKSCNADIGIKGKRQMALFANITHPLYASSREDLVRKSTSLSPKYADLYERHKALDKQFEKRLDDAKTALRSYMIQWRKDNPNASRTALYDEAKFNELFDAEDVIPEQWSKEADELDKLAKEVLTQALTNAGYDGVFISQDRGSWGRSTDAFIALSNKQIKSADLVTYDDDGNVIPISERFNPEKKDIRFSKVVSEEQRLQQENERLRKRLEYWKGQTKLTKGVTLRPEDVQRATKKLLKDNAQKYSEGFSAEDVAKDMQALGEYLRTNGDRADYGHVMAAATEIARDIVENALELANGDQLADIKEIRQYFRGKRINYTSTDIADFNQWRKSHFGSLLIVRSGGIGIDQLWEEAGQQFGYGYFPTDIINPTDMLEHVGSLLSGIEAVFENPYSYYMEDAIAYCANDIINRLLDESTIRTAPPTRADKLAQKIRSEYEQKLEAVKKDRAERYEKLKQHYEDMEAARRARRADSEARTRLLNIAKRLSNRKLPAVTRELLNQYIGDLDLVAKSMTGRTLENLSELRDWYLDEAANNPDFISDPHIERALQRLSKRQIADLTQGEVAQLTQALQNIENEIRTQKKLIDSQVKHDTYVAGSMTVRNIENSEGSRGGAVDRLLTSEVLSPTREMHRITGYVEDDPLYVATKELANGQRKMLDYQRRANARFTRWLEDKGFVRNITGKHAQEIVLPYTDENGNKIVITPAMRMSLYLHSLNDQNLRHIAGGGISVPDMALYKQGNIVEAYNRGVTVKLKPSEIRTICAGMSTQERAFAQAARRYFNEMSAEEINATSEQLKGYSIAQVEDYFPIDTDKSFLSKEFDSIKRDGTIEGMGFLKERINSANPIMLYDLNSVLTKSIGMHAKYVGLAIPVRNFGKLWKMHNGYFGAPAEEISVPADKKIAAGMSDQERYEILKNRTMSVSAKADTEKLHAAEARIGSSAENAKELRLTERKILFKKLGDEFSVFKNYSNSDVKLDFRFSRGNIDESVIKQQGRYEDFAKMLTCFGEVIDNAIGIEVHNKNSEGYKPDKTLANVYVMVSAFEDGERIIPVKLEVKEFKDGKENTLHVAISLHGIEKSEIVNVTNAANRGQANTSPSLTVSVTDLLAKVNPADESFTKYIPKPIQTEANSVVKAVKRKWGQNAYDYIEKMMSDLSNPVRESNALGNLLLKARGNYAGAVLEMNLSVAIKQSASYPTAAAVVGYGPLLKALGDTRKVDTKLIEKYTPLLWYRSQGYSTQELGEMAGRGKQLPKALNWIQMMDVATTTKLWKAAEYYVRDTQKDLEKFSDEYYRAVAEVYNRIIEETQPNYTVMQRPALLRSNNELVKTLNMFKTQPFQNFNILYDAIGDMKAQRRRYTNTGSEEAKAAYKAAQKRAAWAISSQVTASFVFALMQYAWDAFRKKDKKYRDEDGELTLGSFLKGMGINMASNGFGMLPFGGLLLEGGEALTDKLLKTFDAEPFFDATFYGLDDPVVDTVNGLANGTINGIVQTASTIQALASGEKVNWESWARTMFDSVASFMKLGGSPIENVRNLATAVSVNVLSVAEGKYVGGYHALRITSEPEKHAKDYYDLLYKAYRNDKDQYEKLYDVMVKDGFGEDQIRSNMIKRIKEDTGGIRYLPPAQQRQYDEMSEQLAASSYYDAATSETQEDVMTILYGLASGANDSKTKNARERIEGGASVGLDAVEYLEYLLVLQTVDEPTESGKYGTYTQAETQKALDALTELSKKEKSYLWETSGKKWKTNPYN